MLLLLLLLLVEVLVVGVETLGGGMQADAGVAGGVVKVGQVIRAGARYVWVCCGKRREDGGRDRGKSGECERRESARKTRSRRQRKGKRGGRAKRKSGKRRQQRQRYTGRNNEREGQ